MRAYRCVMGVVGIVLCLPLLTGPEASADPDASPLAPFRKASVTSLIDQLQSPVPEARAPVACALRERRSAAQPAVPQLIALLEDDTPVDSATCHAGEWGMSLDRRPTSPGREAARALAQIGAGSFEPLVGALERGGPAGRKHAALALGSLDGRAAEALTGALTDRDARVRRHVAWALGNVISRR